MLCYPSISGVCFYLRSKRSDEIDGKGDLYSQQRQIESDFWVLVPSFTTGQYARFFFHKVETFLFSFEIFSIAIDENCKQSESHEREKSRSQLTLIGSFR